MPFCPKCGKEVSESDVFCPNCGESLKKAEVTGVPGTAVPVSGASGILSRAFDLAVKKPMVFAPALIGGLISMVLSGAAAIWMGAGFWQNWSRQFWTDPLNWPAGLAVMGSILILSLVGGIISYIMFLASIDMSRDAYLDRPLDLGESIGYVLGRLGTFIVASIIGVVFSATFILIPVAILMFVILVVDETGIGTSISRSFNVLGKKLGDVLIMLLVAIVGNVILNLIPFIGGVLSACLNVVIGIAFIALYFEYKKDLQAQV